MFLLGISALVFFTTLLGGFFALHLKDKLHLILGFSAGAVVGVAFFDLLPEALNTGLSYYTPQSLITMAAFGFALYLLLDRMVALHSHGDDEEHHAHAKSFFGAGTLSVHSFLDGLGIGLACKVSPTLGLVVALAVLAHDFSDGINTVNVVLRNHGTRKEAIKWLLADAFAPVLGIVATFFVSVSESSLSLLLALFSGFFLYIGASDLIPESHHNHPVRWTTVATLLGMAVLFVIVQLAA